jgi:carbonic anhydrase
MVAWVLVLLLGEEGTSPPYDALGRLKEGHARFLQGRPVHPNSDPARVRDTGSRGQRPFAAVLGCADSLVPPERLFDQGVGDLFAVRVAGNVCVVNETASLEYAVMALEAPLLLVLGHTQCGAIGAAVTGGDLHGSLGDLVESLRPPVAEARRLNPTAGTKALAAAVVPLNVYASMERLLRGSEPVRERVRDGKLTLLGAVYDVSNGTLEWLGAHPDQERLLGQGPLPHRGSAGHAAQGKGGRPGSPHGPGLWFPSLAGLLMLCSGILLGVAMARRRGSPKAA